MELKLIQKSGKRAEVPVSDARWHTRTGGAGILEFSSPWTAVRAAEGNRVQLSHRGTPVFDGFVFQTESNGKGQSALCYDRLKYLLYKDTRVFQNRTARQIAEEILRERRLEAGTFTETGYVLPLLAMEGRPLLEMIRKALEETRAATGREFVFYDACGEIVLREAADNPAGVLICGENQLISYRKVSDIDGDTFNRFKIWQEDGRSGFRRVTVADDGQAQEKWGVLQYFERVDSRLNPAQVAGRIQALREAKCQARLTLETECLADPACRAGRTVLVRLESGGAVETCLIEEAEQRFSGGAGRMRLKLRKL